MCGHSSRRRVAADTHQRPTRRFRHCMEQPSKGAVPCKEPAERIGPMRSAARLRAKRFPPYLVLLRVGFTLPPPLPAERCALTAPFHPYPGAGVYATASVPAVAGQLGSCVSREALQPRPKKPGGVAEAVSFLWHWPSMGFEAHVPDVIRHTALRSSDFPPPANSSLRPTRRQRPPGPPATFSLLWDASIRPVSGATARSSRSP